MSCKRRNLFEIDFGYKENGEVYKTCKRCRDDMLQESFGIGLRQFDEMALKQDYKCLGCGEVKKLVVDHCHATGKVRGLLCINCNTALGCFCEDIKIMERAKQYLKGGQG
jgi:hypothetical protein